MLYSSSFINAGELFLKIGTYTLIKGEKAKVEVDIIGSSPSPISKIEGAPPQININLKFFIYNLSDTKMYTSDMSELEELKLGTYDLIQSITLFRGMMKCLPDKNAWIITFHETSTKKEPLRVVLTKDEYAKLIKTLQDTIMLKKGIEQNWKQIAQYQSKIQLIQEKE